MALGDFNEILGNQEKSGGRIRPEASFTYFRMMMRHVISVIYQQVVIVSFGQVEE